MKFVAALLLLAVPALSTVYFKETFDGSHSNWIQSEHSSDYGRFEDSHGKWFGDEKIDMGIQTSQPAHFYSISTGFDKFSNKDQDLVVQFSVKHEQKIDCGGGYVKVLPADYNAKDFHGETEYYIMFGPDICGATKRIHVILNYKGENHLIKKTIAAETDELTHVYTLVLKPDQTYAVYVDHNEKATGSLEEDWDFLAPKMIKDPEASKPEDWDDRAKIADPEDTKPEDWDDTPEYIDDPDAEKPEDWDDEMDGEWEAPKIRNPEFKGEWTPKMIDNPNYQGKWVHPEIDNPEYEADSEIYVFDSIGGIGIDIWQVKSGSVFDNFFIADSLEEAKEFFDETTGTTIAGEKAMKAEEDEKKRKEAEEAAAAAAEEEGGDDAYEGYEDYAGYGDYEDSYFEDEEEGHDEL